MQRESRDRRGTLSAHFELRAGYSGPILGRGVGGLRCLLNKLLNASHKHVIQHFWICKWTSCKTLNMPVSVTQKTLKYLAHASECHAIRRTCKCLDADLRGAGVTTNSPSDSSFNQCLLTRPSRMLLDSKIGHYSPKITQCGHPESYPHTNKRAHR